MSVSLTVLAAGPMQGKTIPITIPQFVIGHAAQCHLQAGSPSISEMHCVVESGADKVIVRDLGSASGTFVNDRKIQGPVQLKDGDRLQVGPLVFGLRIASVKKPPFQPGFPHTTPTLAPNRAPVPETAEMNLETAEINLPNGNSPVPNKDNTAGAADKQAEKPAENTASVAAKQLLRKYLRRDRADEPLA